ncbi:hypothetical protein EVG20_g8362 [Dentipellis fragilis]|uniref:LysM domain-containing protein n=1 Tax=Dentipellis fragilis TaxID=205917 RepID=A0A4Y9Y5Y1_9AGAM|nr:hypothetical protein EVG20_g8362 [Dentipellis fragilis]
MFFALPLASLCLLAVQLSGVRAQANCDRFYAVNSGDTCDAISATQHVSTYQLATVNADKIDPACDNIFPGEVLCLGLAGEDCKTTYVVTDVDTCATITTANNVTLTTLLANNPNVNTQCSNIYPGEVLCTATQIFVGGSN